jgi:hypothetical protein
MTATTHGDVVVEFLEDELAGLEVCESTGPTDRLTPFWFSTEELETVALERRFALGIVDGPRVVGTCFERMTITLSIQYHVRKESRRRMLRDLALIWRLLRRLNVRFGLVHGSALKAPVVRDPYEFDYTSALGFVTVSITVDLEYHVEAPVT